MQIFGPVTDGNIWRIRAKHLYNEKNVINILGARRMQWLRGLIEMTGDTNIKIFKEKVIGKRSVEISFDKLGL